MIQPALAIAVDYSPPPAGIYGLGNFREGSAPVAGPVTSTYGAWESWRTSRHLAYDIYCPIGTPIVHTAGPGIVSQVFTWDGKPARPRGTIPTPGDGYSVRGWGLQVTIDSAYYIHYIHLNDRPAFDVGDTVSESAVVGHSGNTGFSSGPHLHWGIGRLEKVGGAWVSKPIDPAMVLFPRAPLRFGIERVGLGKAITLGQALAFRETDDELGRARYTVLR